MSQSHDAVRTTPLDFGITAIDTDYVRPMLDASHLIVEAGRAAFVDTGTNHSVPLLLSALAESGANVADVDYVFLTHIHLDHAGGAGQLLRALPNAKAVIHPRGARHMIDPTRLEQGSRAVYGDERFDAMYGELKPIAAERVVVAEDGDCYALAGRELRAFHTEGHARHHYCLADPASSGVFTGDSFGVSYRELDTAAGEFIYPTTTPIHFDPVAAHQAVDRILEFGPERLYLTHYSIVTDIARLADDMHRRLNDFVAMAREHAEHIDRTNAIRKAMYDYLLRELRAHGAEASNSALREMVSMDVQLNTMGLEHWLDHG